MTRAEGAGSWLYKSSMAVLLLSGLALAAFPTLGQPGVSSSEQPAETGGGGAQNAPSDLEELVSRTTPSVVLLRVFDGFGNFIGSGTGFYVREGVLATNHHVIEPASSLVAVLIDGTEVPVETVLAEDAVHDLALLSLPPGPSPLPLFTGRARAGQQVAVIGSPQGLAGTLSTGIVSAVRPDGLDSGGLPGPLIQIDAAISKGSSGSPVMNLRGEVIGVAVAVLVNGQNLNFAVPIEKLMELELAMGMEDEPLRRVGVDRGSWIRNAVLSVAIFAGLFYGIRRLS